MPDFARPRRGCGNPGKPGDQDSPVCRVKVLPYMFLRLGRITSEGEGLEKVVEVVLEILRERMGMVRSMVGLAQGGRLVIHRSADLSPQEEARGVYSPGEGVIHGCHLPPSLQNPSFLPGSLALGNLDSRLAELEYEMIVESLRRCRGNTSASSRELGITRRVLGIRMARLRIDPQGFKAHSPAEHRALAG